MMTLQAEPSESALKWRRRPVTVAELIEALSDCDAAMPVVVDGYEGGYDSLTADNISVIAMDPDVVKPEFRSWMGDHERAGSYGRSSARSDAGWGGESSNPYIADPSGVVTMPVLLLSRGDKDRGS